MKIHKLTTKVFMCHMLRIYFMKIRILFMKIRELIMEIHNLFMKVRKLIMKYTHDTWYMNICVTNIKYWGNHHENLRVNHEIYTLCYMNIGVNIMKNCSCIHIFSFYETAYQNFIFLNKQSNSNHALVIHVLFLI